MWPFKVTVFHDGKNRDEWGPYMKKIEFFGRAFHIFYRGDSYDVPHDHPWDFWTFPFVTYVEEVYEPSTRKFRYNVVKSWRWHFRNAEYSHRILGRWSGQDTRHGFTYPQTCPGRIYTYVRYGKKRRQWGFWQGTLWIAAMDYINGRVRSWMD